LHTKGFRLVGVSRKQKTPARCWRCGTNHNDIQDLLYVRSNRLSSKKRGAKRGQFITLASWPLFFAQEDFRFGRCQDEGSGAGFRFKHGLATRLVRASVMAGWDVHCRKMDRGTRSVDALPNMVDGGLCHLKKSRFSRTCFGTRVIRVRSIGLEPP
jgi:hypothetical protein